MNRNFLLEAGLIIAALIYFPPALMAQSNQNNAANWLAKADIAPPFAASKSKSEWDTKRKELRNRLGDLLGKLPSRPKLPVVETLSREDRGEYVVEKFQFDNGAGSIVPGYLLLPKV